MRRGTLELTGDELRVFFPLVNSERVTIAMENISDINRVFLNEDEIESFMDILGPDDSNEVLNTVRGKLSELLREI